MNSEISQIIFESFLENKFPNEEISLKGFKVIKPFDRYIFYKSRHHYVVDRESINYPSNSNEDTKSDIDIIYNNKERELNSVLEDLYEECKEEGYEFFSDKAKENAFEMLDFVKNNSKYNWSIYPTKDREIAINCTPEKGKGLLILCDSRGSIAYFKVFDGRNAGYNRSSNIKDFPFSLLKTELSLLNPYLYDDKKLIDTKVQLKSFSILNNEYQIS